MCSDRRQNHSGGQKKTEGTSSAMSGVETAAKLVANSSDVPTEFAAELKKDIVSSKTNFGL